jgi:hypothetical protein
MHIEEFRDRSRYFKLRHGLCSRYWQARCLVRHPQQALWYCWLSAWRWLVVIWFYYWLRFRLRFRLRLVVGLFREQGYCWSFGWLHLHR